MGSAPSSSSSSARSHCRAVNAITSAVHPRYRRSSAVHRCTSSGMTASSKVVPRSAASTWSAVRPVAGTASTSAPAAISVRTAAAAVAPTLHCDCRTTDARRNVATWYRCCRSSTLWKNSGSSPARARHTLAARTTVEHASSSPSATSSGVVPWASARLTSALVSSSIRTMSPSAARSAVKSTGSGVSDTFGDAPDSSSTRLCSAPETTLPFIDAIVCRSSIPECHM